MTERRMFRWALTSARVLIGSGVAVAVVVAVVLAIALPWPRVSAEPVRVEATPAPADTVLACDGPLLALGRVVEAAGQVSVAAAQTVVAGPDAAAAQERTLASPADSAPLVFTAPADGSAPAAFAAAGSSTVQSADLRGFAASACRPPLLESWIVGGATTTGASDLLILANPGAVPATVQVTVYGAAGPVTPPGGTDRVIAAGTQAVVPLAGLLPSEESPVVHVTASGAPVSAALQSSIIRTLEPGGVDQVSPIAAAAATTVIPSVRVATIQSGPSASALVRVLSPGADTDATVTVLDADGTAVGDPTAVPLAAGVPSELDLSALTAGAYSIVVEAPVPVVAAAWATTGFEPGSDFAWYAPSPEVARGSVFAVPVGPDGVLTLVNRGAADATIALTAPGGSTRDVTVRAGTAAQVPVSASGVYELVPSAPVFAGVSFAGDGALAGFPVWSADAATPPVPVYP